MKNSRHFEFGAVQRHAYLVDLEKSEKCAYSRYRSCRYSRERASQNIYEMGVPDRSCTRHADVMHEEVATEVVENGKDSDQESDRESSKSSESNKPKLGNPKKTTVYFNRVFSEVAACSCTECCVYRLDDPCHGWRPPG